MQQMEMQVTKAQNLIDHKDEIYSRAPRTWIQTTQQRKEAKGCRHHRSYGSFGTLR
jgi:ATP-dependent RNA helicase DDX27